MPKVAIPGVDDLATLYPELVKDWYWDKNKYGPDHYLPHSGVMANWKCHKCDYEWPARIYSRSYGNGCPACAGQRLIVGQNDLKSQRPDLAAEWDYEANGLLRPEDVMVNYGKGVHWVCAKGHHWKVSPNSRVSQYTGCEICSSELRTSFGEQAILYYVRKIVDAESRVKIKGKELDIYISSLKIAIEYDGIYFHTGNEAEERENKKNKMCQQNGIRLLRVKECRKNQSIEEREDVFFRFVEKETYLEEAIRWVIDIVRVSAKYDGEIDINLNRDRTEIHEAYISIEKDNSLEAKYPLIAAEWDNERNGDLKPSHFSYGSKEKVWWRCKLGHPYATQISHRTDEKTGTGCPYCAGQKIMPGFNDLASLRPDLMEEWDYEKNEEYNPNTLSPNYSAEKVWWICSRGHGYMATPHKRNNGRNCPYCANKKVLVGYNDLESQFPEIVLDWDYEKNDGLLPSEVVTGSNKRVYWKCHLCNELWEATVNARTQGKGKCTKCKGKGL